MLLESNTQIYMQVYGGLISIMILVRPFFLGIVGIMGELLVAKAIKLEFINMIDYNCRYILILIYIDLEGSVDMIVNDF